MEKLSLGFVDVTNPYNSRQVRRVSLLPEDVDVLVCWTRDPQNILAGAEELTKRGFRFYVMVTVTGYPPVLEPDMVRATDALSAMKELARKISPESVIWRYDPILLSNVTGIDFHRENFKILAQNLKDSSTRVIISMYDEYRGSQKRLEGMERAGELRLFEAGEGLTELLGHLAESAGEVGMEIQSCARKEDFSPYGIKPGACIDSGLITKLWGLETKGKDKNQRPNCLCCQSVDIGNYGICPAGCVYCYAW
jgi:hypothetical protein